MTLKTKVPQELVEQLPKDVQAAITYAQEVATTPEEFGKAYRHVRLEHMINEMIDFMNRDEFSHHFNFSEEEKREIFEKVLPMLNDADLD